MELETVKISQELANEILATLKEELNFWYSEWESVSLHPFSHHKENYDRIQSLIEKIEIELLKL